MLAHMWQVRCQAVRWVCDSNPGFAEVALTEVDGAISSIIEKKPVLEAGDLLRADSDYPFDIEIACEVLARGADSLTIRLAAFIEAVDGRRTFRVAPDRVSVLD